MKAIGIIDVQNDFMLVEGKLSVPNAMSIAPKLVEIVDYAKANNIVRFFTADRHDGTESEMQVNGGPFPLHCMMNDKGEEIISEVDVAGCVIFNKRCYNVFDKENGNKDIENWLKMMSITDVLLCGVVGNICVEAAAMGLLQLGINVTLIEDAIMWMHINVENNEAKSRMNLSLSGAKFSKFQDII